MRSSPRSSDGGDAVMTQPREIRVVLDEDDFTALVDGKEVAKDGARIILADIGWARMGEILESAHNRQRRHNEAIEALLRAGG